ncbi:OmpA family protein [Alteromonas sediminis]|uniref:OmpA family protein n=1 Tax=Alteromonas sediminis TaxID=2259342 RepID=A0A3N5XZ25_9ALTE|nr:OmpA family protein [Alteromonas sediminis]RPJ65266.1 OmpA family protein [Alteromonas sediminis]
MKTKLTALTLALSLGSAAALANSNGGDDNYKWVGVYGSLYDINKDKPYGQPGDYLDNGLGLGIEAGWKFTPKWGLRAEFTKYNIKTDGGYRRQSGSLYGVDAVYFFPEDTFYAFTGVKKLSLDESYGLFNIGVGKHWGSSDYFRVITEVAANRDFGQGTKDVAFKVGIAFNFGTGGYLSSSEPAAVAPLDSDNDGVLDRNDRCPGTAPGVNVDANGCPMEKDSDSDGVADSADKCPNTPRGDVVDAEGCTRFGEEEVSKTVRVLFANDSAKVEEPNDSEIIDLVNFLKRYGKVQAVIEGHASTPGDADYNMDLSKRRANAFKDVLVDKGIDASRLSTEGYGETRLLDSSNTAAAHRLNRRIVVNVSEVIKVKLTK